MFGLERGYTPPVNLPPLHLPTSTYRLQLGKELQFRQAQQLLPYLRQLGIGAVYLSPFFRARVGSTHGYDVVDHSQLNPELGTEEDFAALAEAAREQEIGLIVDIVPNHMGVDDPHNVWWQDVLENGPASHFAHYFDIDWNPPKESLRGKVLLPVLGDQFGKVLEAQEIRLIFENGRFWVQYFERRLPTDPHTCTAVLRSALDQVAAVLDDADADRMELESIVTALEHLPPRDTATGEAMGQRYRESEVARRRLAQLTEDSGEVRQAIARSLERWNGQSGQPASFDQLETLLAAQPYRLCYWRVATDEINYRRFFDVDALAAIRVEEPDVFTAVHAMILRFVERGWVTGLRIDHADGLLDPQDYLTHLSAVVRQALGETAADYPVGQCPLYLVVEKILAHDECLPQDWPVHGTTGYDFLNLLNGLFVDRRGAYALRDTYARAIGRSETFSQVLHESKRAILSASLSSELYMLSHQLDRLSERHRWSRDFTRFSLYRALREVVASFPVYRTYVRPGTIEVAESDRRRILSAVSTAKRRNPAMSPSFFDFIASVLLLEDPAELTDEARQERHQFALKFQQVTGPVTAKGWEDTAFYRFYPLASLNEVGGDPAIPGTSVEQFHRRLQDLQLRWPYDMHTTGTHDTKRGEDLRARLNVLSEIPDAWAAALAHWQTMNASARVELDGAPAPDSNEEYLIYQTLLGTWPQQPLDDAARSQYLDRIIQYLDKALKEAKLHSSWLNPYEEYDRAVANFVRSILGDFETPFAQELAELARSVAEAGFVNGLAQALLKISAPGVPDFYQGTELWDFNLVDPDNRRPVDFAKRQASLTDLVAAASRDLTALAHDLLSQWPDERIKQFVVWRALQLRQATPQVFFGEYIPLAVDGERKTQVCAFARRAGPDWVVCVVPRLAQEACHNRGDVPGNASAHGAGQAQWVPAAWWRGTRVVLPEGAPQLWTHQLTGEQVEVGHEAPSSLPEPALDVEALLARFPVALLWGRGV